MLSSLYSAFSLALFSRRLHVQPDWLAFPSRDIEPQTPSQSYFPILHRPTAHLRIVQAQCPIFRRWGLSCQLSTSALREIHKFSRASVLPLHYDAKRQIYPPEWTFKLL